MVHEYYKSGVAEAMRRVNPSCAGQDLVLSYYMSLRIPITPIRYRKTLFLGAHETSFPSVLGAEPFFLNVLGLVFKWPYIGLQNRQRRILKSELRVLQASYDDMPGLPRGQFELAFMMPSVSWDLVSSWVQAKLIKGGRVIVAEDMPYISGGSVGFALVGEPTYLRETKKYWLECKEREGANLVVYSLKKE